MVDDQGGHEVNMRRGMALGATLLFAAFGLFALGCSGSGHDTENLSEIKDKLVSAHFKCGDPAPYTPDSTEIDLGGANPVETFECTIDGAPTTITVSRWRNSTARSATLLLIKGLACGFGSGDYEYVASGPWAIVADNSSDKGGPKAANEAAERAGNALGIRPTRIHCDDSGATSGGLAFKSDELTTEASTTTSTREGSRAKPLKVGQAATLKNWDITITGIVPNATAAVQQANQFNDPPSKGQYMEVELRATYRGAAEQSPDMALTVKLSGADHVQYADYECGAVVGQHDVSTLESGGTASWAVCLNVPPAAIPGGLIFVEDQLAFTSGETGRAYWAVP